LTYAKHNKARYIGHLDLQTIFQRAVSRAGIRARYSEGFNPHPILSFAAPLSVGMSALADIVDVDIVEQLNCADIIERINQALPAGLNVHKCEEIAISSKSAAARLRKARYSMEIKYEMKGAKDMGALSLEPKDSCASQASQALYAAQAVELFNKSKSEISGLVYEIHADGETPGKITAIVACGGFGNLKPSRLAEELCGLTNVTLCPFSTEYTREELELAE